ncbi:MAG: hypothetical protein U0T83_10545 [Bacteriovoracaceae bacterium]
MRKKILLTLVILIATFQVGTKLYNSHMRKNENARLLKLTQNNAPCVKLFSYECRALLYLGISSADFYYARIMRTSLQKTPEATSKLINNPQTGYLKPHLMATILKIPKEQVETFLQNEKGNIDLLEDAGIALMQFEITKLLELKGKNSKKYDKIIDDFDKNLWKKLKPELHKDLTI